VSENLASGLAAGGRITYLEEVLLAESEFGHLAVLLLVGLGLPIH
jgi:hypothetical protein